MHSSTNYLEKMIETPFGWRSLTETLGMVVQLECVGCVETAEILRREIQTLKTVIHATNG